MQNPPKNQLYIRSMINYRECGGLLYNCIFLRRTRRLLQIRIRIIWLLGVGLLMDDLEQFFLDRADLFPANDLLDFLEVECLVFDEGFGELKWTVAVVSYFIIESFFKK